jgi:hypothetical protein
LKYEKTDSGQDGQKSLRQHAPLCPCTPIPWRAIPKNAPAIVSPFGAILDTGP